MVVILEMKQKREGNRTYEDEGVIDVIVKAEGLRCEVPWKEKR